MDMYKTEYDFSEHCQGKFYPRGPGNGLGPHGGYLNPGTRFESKEICEQVTSIANEVYKRGYEKAQYDMQKSMGINTGKDNEPQL